MSGVLIIGASRSGTSMTAGLFAQHGVEFGICAEPSRYNAKGYFENKWLKRVYKGQECVSGFGSAWKEQLRREGWNDGLWGAKCGAERWAQFWQYVPDVSVIVQCYRPKQQIEASRRNAGFNPHAQAIDGNWRIMDQMRESAAGPRCFPVWTDRFVEGDFSALAPAFAHVGLSFDEDIAREWVDPTLWKHGEVA